MAAAFNVDHRTSGVPAVYGMVRPRNPCTTPVKRPCLSLQVVQPTLFPPIGKGSKTRQVNEKLEGYVHSPREQQSRDLPTTTTTTASSNSSNNNNNNSKLPPLREARAALRQRALKPEAVGVPRYERRIAARGRVDRPIIPDDILPPLKFHSSLHNRMPFQKRASRCPRWLFQEPERASARFADDTFRIFRPMLYSVLMTQRMTPKIRAHVGDNRRTTAGSGTNASLHDAHAPSPNGRTVRSREARLSSGSDESGVAKSRDAAEARESHPDEEDRQSGSCKDPNDAIRNH